MHPKDRQFKVMGGHVDHDACDYIATVSYTHLTLPTTPYV